MWRSWIRAVHVAIPADVSFQFRATGDDALTFLCVTMPPWKSGVNVKVPDHRW
jgi:mannose-6-phosphate isomerase-like protein (cupin superfamily)